MSRREPTFFHLSMQTISPPFPGFLWLLSITAPLMLSSYMVLPAETSTNLIRVLVTNPSDLVNGDTTDIPSLFTNPGADGISFREAVYAAEGTTGPKLIEFAADLKGVVITVGSAPSGKSLQFLLSSGQLTINGDIDHDGTPDIMLQTDPTHGGSSSSFAISSSSNTIAGLIISNFNGAAICFEFQTPDCAVLEMTGNSIVNNYIYSPSYEGVIGVSCQGTWYGGEALASFHNRTVRNTTIRGNRLVGNTNGSASCIYICASSGGASRNTIDGVVMEGKAAVINKGSNSARNRL